LEVLTHGAEARRTDVQRLSGDVGVEAAHDRVAEIVDRKELIAVRPVAEDRDPASFPDPVEQDLEDSEPLGPEEGLRTHDDDLEAPPGAGVAEPLRVDLRLAVVADPDERIALVDGMALGHAV